MFTTQEFQGRLNELKGKVKEKYGQLTDDDFRVASGSIDQLIGKIQQRTGQARESIVAFFESLETKDSSMQKVAGQAADYVSQAAETVRETAAQATEKAKEGYEQVVAKTSEGFEEAQRMVQKHPKETLLVALGVGALVGLMVGLCGRSQA